MIDGVTYIGSSAAVGTQSPAASTAHAPGVTTEADEAVNGTATSKSAATTGRSTTGRITTAGKTTSAAPTVTYPAAATTGMEETFVSLGVNFDSNVLEAFGCDGKDFAEISAFCCRRRDMRRSRKERAVFCSCVLQSPR